MFGPRGNPQARNLFSIPTAGLSRDDSYKLAEAVGNLELIVGESPNSSFDADLNGPADRVPVHPPVTQGPRCSRSGS